MAPTRTVKLYKIRFFAYLQQYLARVRVPDEIILRVRLELVRELDDELLEKDGVQVLGQQEDEEPVPELGLLHEDVHPLLQVE